VRTFIYSPKGCKACRTLFLTSRFLTYFDASLKAVTAGAGIPVKPKVMTESKATCKADAVFEKFIAPGGAV
jgi:hypothetical protein